MSKLSTTEIGANHHQVSVRLEMDDVKLSFEKSLKDQAKNAEIAGFRKGMVPMGLIKKMKGDAILSHTLFHKVEHVINDHIKDNNLAIVGHPIMVKFPEHISHADTAASYDFEFEIGIKPSFQLADIKKCKVTKYQVEITPEMILEEIDTQARKFGSLSEEGEIKSLEDIVHLDFKSSEHPTEEPKNDVLLVKYFHKSFAPSLIGKKINESFSTSLKDAFEEKELKWIMKDLKLQDNEEERKKVYTIQITKVSHIQAAPKDESLFKKIYPNLEIKSETECEAKIKEDMNNAWSDRAKNYTYNEIYLYWVNQTSIALPEAFLKKWYTQQENYKKADTDQAEKEQLDTFLSQLKWTLILDNITSAEKMEVDKDRMMEHIQQEVDAYYVNYPPEQKNGIIMQLLNNADYLYKVQQQLLNDKVFEWAIAQAIIQEKKISVDDFLTEVEKSKTAL